MLVFESLRVDVAAERRRSAMYIATLQRIREELRYVERSPARDTIKLMIDAALETDEVRHGQAA